MMQLVEVQAKLAAVNKRYVNWLEWTENNGVIKAVPKRKLPMNAAKAIRKVFKKLGGGHVRHNGESYYELVTRERAPSNSRIAQAFRELEENGIFEEAQ